MKEEQSIPQNCPHCLSVRGYPALDEDNGDYYCLVCGARVYPELAVAVAVAVKAQEAAQEEEEEEREAIVRDEKGIIAIRNKGKGRESGLLRGNVRRNVSETNNTKM